MLKILIADDSEVVRRLAKAALSGVNGWTLCGEAADGQQAVLLAHELKPDIMVMDLAMPLMDGLNAAREILKFAPELPIVLYTLHKTPEIELEAKKTGIRAVIAKSAEIETLLGAIRELTPITAAALPLETPATEVFPVVNAESIGELSTPAANTMALAAAAADAPRAGAAFASTAAIGLPPTESATANGTTGVLPNDAEGPSANGPKIPPL
jgi:DNA-binding NarL/FixJ family response regulator